MTGLVMRAAQFMLLAGILVGCSDSPKMAAEAEACTEHIEGGRSTNRVGLHAFAAQAASSRRHVILEATSSTWGGYHVAYLWVDSTGKGRVVTTMAGRNWSQKLDATNSAAEIQALLTQAESMDLDRGTTHSVEDAPCMYGVVESNPLFAHSDGSEHFRMRTREGTWGASCIRSNA